MRRWPALILAAAVGAVAGALLVLALPVPGADEEPSQGPSRLVPPLVVEEPMHVTTMLVWTPSQVPPGLGERIESLQSVANVTVVRSGAAWLEGWDEQNAPEGLAVPVEVAAIDHATYRDFVPPADRSIIDGLRGAGAVLGRSAAAIRGMDVGGVLRFPRHAFRVEGVLDDSLVGSHEIIVGLKEGADLGIERPRYILVEPQAGTSPAAVERAIRRATPGGVQVRIRRPGETPVFRHGDAVLPQITVKELFGEFAAAPRPDGTLAVEAAWEREHIVSERVPVLGEFRCHRLVMPLVRSAMDELVDRGLGRLVNGADFGGCYYPRYIASDEGSGISHHSWGIAIDINVSEGLPGRQPTIDRRIVDAFERQGFVWGGRFLIPDGTHFEFQRFP